jgi:hypothetical protein
MGRTVGRPGRMHQEFYRVARLWAGRVKQAEREEGYLQFLGQQSKSCGFLGTVSLMLSSRIVYRLHAQDTMTNDDHTASQA